MVYDFNALAAIIVVVYFLKCYKFSHKFIWWKVSKWKLFSDVFLEIGSFYLEILCDASICSILRLHLRKVQESETSVNFVNTILELDTM